MLCVVEEGVRPMAEERSRCSPSAEQVARAVSSLAEDFARARVAVQRARERRSPPAAPYFADGADDLRIHEAEWMEGLDDPGASDLAADRYEQQFWGRS